MIFVTVGTEKYPFERVVAEVDRLAGAGAFGDREVLIQTGSTALVPQHARHQPRLSYGEMVETVARAEVVVAHGGAGSFMLCRQQATPLIAVPRLHRLGENLDDHQVLFCRRLDQLGLLTAVEDVVGLEAAIRDALDHRPDAEATVERDRLVEALEETTSSWGLQ